MTKTIRRGGPLLLAALAIGGCGTGNDDASATKQTVVESEFESEPDDGAEEPAGMEAIGSCDVVSREEVAAAWGGEVASVDGDDLSSGCTFTEMTTQDVPVPAVVISGFALHGATCADLRSEDVGEVTEVEGFGDGAWWLWETDLEAGQLNACTAAHLFDVQVFADDDAAARATAEELMRLLLDRV